MRRIGGSAENRGGFSVMSWTYGEEDEEALVLLAHTVVDPGTMVVHLTDAALTDAAEEEQQQHLFWVFWGFFFLPDWLKFCQCKQKYTQLFFFSTIYNIKSNFFFLQHVRMNLTILHQRAGARVSGANGASPIRFYGENIQLYLNRAIL